jgi:hypothetical protein
MSKFSENIDLQQNDFSMVNLSFNELSSFSIQTGSYFDGFRNISGGKKVKV